MYIFIYSDENARDNDMAFMNAPVFVCAPHALGAINSDNINIDYNLVFFGGWAQASRTFFFCFGADATRKSGVRKHNITASVTRSSVFTQLLYRGLR